MPTEARASEPLAFRTAAAPDAGDDGVGVRLPNLVSPAPARDRRSVEVGAGVRGANAPLGVSVRVAVLRSVRSAPPGP